MAKKVIKLTVKHLREIIKESISKHLTEKENNSMHLFEMATIGAQKWGNFTYSIQIHGASTADRSTPHIHIYRYNDNTKKQFNFEISLVDLVSKNIITLIYQVDREKHLKHTNKTNCTWTGYKEIYDGVKKYLFGEVQSPQYKAICFDNLDAAIYAWNIETDMLKTLNGGNPLKEKLEQQNISILTMYQKYFEPKKK